MSGSCTENEAFKLLGLVWSRAPAPDITLQVKRLSALHRPDGGWAQLPTMAPAPDAYTGQALGSEYQLSCPFRSTRLSERCWG